MPRSGGTSDASNGSGLISSSEGPISASTGRLGIARGQERQVMLDAMTKEREPGHSDEWNAGFDAALTIAIRILVKRSHTRIRGLRRASEDDEA